MAKVKRKKTTPSIASSPMSKEIPKPESAGEELYQVHLQRKAGAKPAEEDFDELQPRKRTHSVGEELWGVHLKRSHGVEPDGDNAEEHREEQDTKNPAAATTKKKESSEPRSIHLRNRDVLINNQ
jgi:hypothetical protein